MNADANIDTEFGLMQAWAEAKRSAVEAFTTWQTQFKGKRAQPKPEPQPQQPPMEAQPQPPMPPQGY